MSIEKTLQTAMDMIALEVDQITDNTEIVSDKVFAHLVNIELEPHNKSVNQNQFSVGRTSASNAFAVDDTKNNVHYDNYGIKKDALYQHTLLGNKRFWKVSAVKTIAERIASDESYQTGRRSALSPLSSAYGDLYKLVTSHVMKMFLPSLHKTNRDPIFKETDTETKDTRIAKYFDKQASVTEEMNADEKLAALTNLLADYQTQLKSAI
jgi:hypothetical protein